MTRETTRDAVATIAQCLTDVAGLSRDDKTEAAIAFHGASLARVIGQVRWLMQQGAPMLPDVKQSWDVAIDTAFNCNDEAFLALLQNGLVMALKQYQHPEIAIGLHSTDHINPNEDTDDDDDN